MRIVVRTFAALRERRGAGSEELELEPGATAGLVRARVCPPDLTCAIAVNGQLCGPDVALVEGDEVALLPPLGGG